MIPPMKITVNYLNHEPSDSFAAHLEKELRAFGAIRQIDEARASLERRPEMSPPFRVALHLITPGPDFAAEAVDHTFRAALTKAINELHGKIEDRLASRKRREVRDPKEPSAQPGAKTRKRR